MIATVPKAVGGVRLGIGFRLVTLWHTLAKCFRLKFCFFLLLLLNIKQLPPIYYFRGIFVEI
jgi:hypothetical protein